MLASCAKPFSPAAKPVVQPAAKAVDPRLCAPSEPEPPVVGSIVAPVTPVEVEATRDHLTSDAEARAWGRRGWDRAALAREGCKPPPAPPPRPG